LQWDLDVDMVCTGSGVAGLASAIAGGDLGGDVFVAGSPRADVSGEPVAALRRQSEARSEHPWLDTGVSDLETTDYLAALSSDLGPGDRPSDAGLPISVVHEVPVEPGLTVAPFYGAKLREWTARCLASPYGFLHTRLSDWWTTTLHTLDGETIEVAEIGSMTTDPDNGGLLDWLGAQARDRGIEIQPDCALHRIVFEDGDAVGAVFATPDGPLAVHARYGVTVTTGSPTAAAPPHHVATAGAPMRVCLVSRYASRFGRVELLTSQPPATESAAACGSGSRPLHVNLHETQGESPVWRCSWGAGYPRPDQ
jgi:hypothetical protein